MADYEVKNRVWCMSMLVCSVVFMACDDDDNGLKTQAHDDNEMMPIMHDMRRTLDARTMTKDADHDITMMMIPHHQSAITMADAEISYGTIRPLPNLISKKK